VKTLARQAALLLAVVFLGMWAFQKACPGSNAQETERLKAVRDSAKGVADSLRTAIAVNDSARLVTIDSLMNERGSVETRIVVVERERERAEVIQDSTWGGLRENIARLAPELIPLADAHGDADHVTRELADERITNADRLTQIADSTSGVWRESFLLERSGNQAIEGELTAERDLSSNLQDRLDGNVGIFGLRFHVNCIIGGGPVLTFKGDVTGGVGFFCGVRP